MRSLQLLASRVAAAVAREARGGGGAGGNSTRAAATTATTATTATATTPTTAPPPPIVTVRGLDDPAAAAATAPATPAAAAKAARRAESVALLRQLNVGALPQVRGQTVLARVVRASRHELLLDPGYYGLCAVPRAGVMPAAAASGAGAAQGDAAPSSAAASPDAGSSSTKNNNNNNNNVAGASLVRVGDYVRVRLAELYTPYGDPQLEPVRTPRAARDKLVLRELARRMRQGAPVQGRVLNACAGGYSVGVGGYVALLRTEQAPAEVVRAVGVLQPFYVHKISRAAAAARRGGGDDDEPAGRGRRRRGGAADDAQQRTLIELTCTIQRAGVDGSGGLYTNV